MQIKPNRTVLEGLVREIRPQPDGWGADVDLDVLSNLSPEASEDFLRSSHGDCLTAFWARSEPLQVGETIRAQLTLHGGPGGQRAVIQSIERVAPKPES
jgi:hypothetical protein